MAIVDMAHSGLCDICSRETHHGSWTAQEIADVVADTGEPEFSDWCDNCLVENCFGGDITYAAKMIGRPVSIGFRALFKQ